jgi:putative ABC transport system permease protein
MPLREIIAMAFGSLGVHKLRSVLTMAGITIGVFSVIGVMTAVSALRGSIESGLSFLGASTFQISKYPVGIQIGGEGHARMAKRRNITYEQARRYRELMEGTTDVIRFMTWSGGIAQAVYGIHKTTPNLRYGGTNEHFLEANQFNIDIGRNLTPEDVDLRRPVALVGQVVVQDLFPAESPLGRKILVKGHAYTVVGTFAAKGTVFGESEDEIVVVPISRFLEDNGSEHTSINIATGAPSQAEYNATLEKAVTEMRVARGLRPGEENDFEVYSNDSLIAAFAKIADVVSDGAFVVSAIALLAAGVGIMNIMLVSVTERTKEIGIRKSIGARRASILTQFLIEAVVLSVTGGIAGILMGVVAGDGLALLLKADVVFPWGWTAAGLLVCSGIGVGFGFYPALRAAMLDPIEALRYE